MKKKPEKVSEPDTIWPEYDFRGGVRGKYAKRYAEGTNVVIRQPDGTWLWVVDQFALGNEV